MHINNILPSDEFGFTLPLAASWLIAVAVLSLGAPSQMFSANAAEKPEEVGTTVSVRNRLTGTLGEEKRRLRKGARVHREELLETSRKGQAELQLDDDTKLALGPRAQVKLDEFVIGKASQSTTTIALNFLKGTFRFITGKRESESYRIKTPSATIGVRGTVFDVYVDRKGDTLVLLHEGEVEICSAVRACRRHNTVGRIIHATVAGVVSLPLKFTRKLIPGVTVARAFPFVGRRLRLDPIRRLRRADIIDAPIRPVKRAGKTIRRGGRTIRRTLRKVSPFR